MSVKCNGALEVLEAELADVYLGEGGKVRRVGRGIPHVHLIAAKLHQTKFVVLTPFTTTLMGVKSWVDTMMSLCATSMCIDM